MSLEIIPIGGFSEIGRNCCAVKVDDEVVICDLGLMLDKYIEYTDDEDLTDISPKKLIEVGAAPDIWLLDELKKNVVGICISHGHLDHVGAIPYLANRLDADIHATPMTCEVIKNLTNRDRRPIRNAIIDHPVNCKFKLTSKISIEFIHVTHSIPHTVGIVVHSNYGSVLYMNDFKIDHTPMLGQKTNMKRLEALNGIKCIVMDSLYADHKEKTPSEKIAHDMLFDQLLNTETDGKAIVITTFSSHIARMKSIVQLGEKLGRKVIMMGRSIDKYLNAAEKANVISFKGKIKVLPYRSKVDAWLKKKHDLSKYIIVMTGGQGEPKAVLARTVASGLLRLQQEDIVVFSCKVIPVSVNIENRHKLEENLQKQHVRIFSDIHVSGHGAKEDHRDLLKLLQPEHIIPTHGGMAQLGELKDMAVHDLGYKPEKVHILYNGQRVRLA
ncbi:MAG: MBL fold metallo-hydrolase [Candidatus Woesearchaeota archaeon]|nr:MBL fold metallo-hydrolase [Candidatus Woesearchaeota archaeon]